MAEAEVKIGKITKIAKTLTDVDKVSGEHFQKIAPNREYFDRLMAQKVEKHERMDQMRVEEASKPTPMEEAQRAQLRIDRAQGTNARELVSQADAAIERMDSVKRKLSTPNIDMKSSVKNVLRNKLAHIDENLKVAMAKVGVDYVPPEAPKGLLSPVKKFLGYLAHGQHQLENMSTEIAKMEQEGADKLSPSKLLTVQLKMGFIQQELEFFASLLNKTLESTKTLMNVQV